ncbi:MAG: diguanylate cyclase [Anaerolineae bacterium]|jgi:diguanylate cyclase (GGDEF)-like protein|nr:diguanylate cyclase [Anaerolineae bacterium]
MWNSLRKFLSPPVFEGQREKTRHARLLHYGILIIFVFSIVLYWLNWTIGTEAEREQTWILGLLSLALIPAYFLIRAGYVKEVSFFLLTALWVIMTSFGRYVAGIHDIAMMVYFLIMLVSAILLGSRITIIYTLTSIAAVWWLAFLETSGELVPVIGAPYRIDIDMTVVFIMAFVIVIFFIRALTTALQDAKREMSERLRVEAKLEKAIVLLSDEIDVRKEAQVKLQEQAITDFLTGLFNRRYFFEIAQKEFAKALRYNRPLSIMIFDLDLFKNINDTYGHDVGDQALMQIGDLLRNTIRDIDISARYGGEEFIILLPEMTCKRANIAAERLRKEVEEMPIQIGGLLVHLTISIGVDSRVERVLSPKLSIS